MTKESLYSTVRSYMDTLQFPEDSQKDLLAALDTLAADESCFELLQRYHAIYKESFSCEYEEMLTELAKEAERVCVPTKSA